MKNAITIFIIILFQNKHFCWNKSKRPKVNALVPDKNKSVKETDYKVKGHL